MGLLVGTDDSQIGKINQLNQVSIRILRKLFQASDRIDQAA